MAIRILISDDHCIMRSGIRALLEQNPENVIVGEAADGQEAVSLAEETKPDMVLMDVAMPVLNGVEATRRICAANPKMNVVMLSAHGEANVIRQCFEAGAKAYLLKDAAFEEVLAAVATVQKGELYISTHVAAHVIRSIMQAGTREPPAHNPLSARECEVLRDVAEGMSTKQIAAKLLLSVKTIETHRANIMAKLNLFSVAELTKYAIRRGLSSID
jgi:DNA-binding NarL/FixJ family response regulator